MSENEWTNFSKGLSTERIECGTCDDIQAENARLREALRRIEIYAENHMEGAGMPEFKQFENIVFEAHEALTQKSGK